MKVYAFGPFIFDEADAVVRANGKALLFGDKVTTTLLALLERPGEMLTMEELVARIWPEGYVDRASLSQNIYVLRRAFRDYWDEPVIETVRRRGYRIAVPVRLLANGELTPRASGVRTSAFSFIAAAIVMLFFLFGLPASTVAPKHAIPALSQADARLYALGMLYWNMRGRENTWKSVSYFSKLVRSEPANALGYSGLAYAYALIADYDYGPQPASVYLQLLRINAERAISLDRSLSEAHVALAKTYELADRNFVAAEREFDHAIALDPKNAVARHWYSVLLITEGKDTQSRHEIEIAQRLDPANPSINSWVAVHRYLARDYTAAIAYDRWSLAVQPDNITSLSVLGAAYEQMHAFASALRIYRLMGARCKCATAGVLEARADALLGRTREAFARLRNATTSVNEPADPLAAAAAFIAMGQSEAALQYVRQAASEPYSRIWLERDPRFDSLRQDPRFITATST